MISRTPARKALRNRRGGTGVGLGKAVAKASVGPPRGVMVVTRETFIWAGKSWGGGVVAGSCIYIHIHTTPHVVLVGIFLWICMRW